MSFFTLQPQRKNDDLKKNFFELKAKGIDGKDIPLQTYRGSVCLVVNVASKCGFTPQYTDLQTLYAKYKDKGFVVLGFPCGQFLSQEHTDDAAIKEFACSRYKVSFPMFSKIRVNGSDTHPVYQWLRAQPNAEGLIKWNFTKFLVGRDGKVLQRYGVSQKPLDFEKDIEAALNATVTESAAVATTTADDTASVSASGSKPLTSLAANVKDASEPPKASTL